MSILSFLGEISFGATFDWNEKPVDENLKK